MTILAPSKTVTRLRERENKLTHGRSSLSNSLVHTFYRAPHRDNWHSIWQSKGLVPHSIHWGCVEASGAAFQRSLRAPFRGRSNKYERKCSVSVVWSENSTTVSMVCLDSQIWHGRTIWWFPVCRRPTIQIGHRSDREGVSFRRRRRIFCLVFVPHTECARTTQRSENIDIVRHVHGGEFSGSHGIGHWRLLWIRIVFTPECWHFLKPSRKMALAPLKGNNDK